MPSHDAAQRCRGDDAAPPPPSRRTRNAEASAGRQADDYRHERLIFTLSRPKQSDGRGITYADRAPISTHWLGLLDVEHVCAPPRCRVSRSLRERRAMRKERFIYEDAITTLIIAARSCRRRDIIYEEAIAQCELMPAIIRASIIDSAVLRLPASSLSARYHFL